MKVYELRGRVIRGEGWGRKIGYPTANLDHAYFRRHPIPSGVYAAFVDLGRRRYRALAIIGVPFTWQLSRRKLELYLLQFSGNLVGRSVQAILIRRLRPIQKFLNVQGMLSTIKTDIAAAKKILDRHGKQKTTGRN